MPFSSKDTGRKGRAHSSASCDSHSCWKRWDVWCLCSLFQACEDTEKRWCLALGRTTLDAAPTCVPVFGCEAEQCLHTCLHSSSLAGDQGDVLLLTAVQPTSQDALAASSCVLWANWHKHGKGPCQKQESLLELSKCSKAWPRRYAQGNGLPAGCVSHAGRAPEKSVLRDALQCRQLLKLTLLAPLHHAQLLHQNLSTMKAHRWDSSHLQGSHRWILF